MGEHHGVDERSAATAVEDEHRLTAGKVLGFTGRSVVPGRDRTRRRGTDILSGTTTLPQILAIAEDPEIGREIAAVSASGESADDLDALCDLLALHPGTAAARQMALDEVARAMESLDGDIGDADVEALGMIAAGVVDRFA